MESVTEYLNKNIIAFLALIVSAIALSFTVLNYLETRAKINIKQINRKSSFLIKPDRVSDTNPDVYWNSAYRVISDVVITNSSSKPITIVEFRLNNKFTFNGYTNPGESYSAKTQLSEYRTKEGIVIGQPSKSERFPILDSWLKPIITIPPHTAIRGHLFFNVDNSSDVQIGKNNLTIITSRKTFKTKLEITEEHMSLLPLEAKYVEAQSQTS